ncbi:hypothetical protein OMK64_20440, partial [Cellulomonas fimi]|uniref:hypothetical protein n=1 Tax=Cellulomonas fimi TaxID=1708 RepID=UPI00234C07ED
MRSTAPTHPATPDQPVPDGTAGPTAGPAHLRRRRALRGAAALLAAAGLVGGTLVAPATAGAPTALPGAPA